MMLSVSKSVLPVATTRSIQIKRSGISIPELATRISIPIAPKKLLMFSERKQETKRRCTRETDGKKTSNLIEEGKGRWL